MMRDETKAILDDLLGRWHFWAKSDKLTPQKVVCAMFSGMRSPRSWDSTDDILDSEVNNKIMKAVDFAVTELQDPHRTAIYINARNCHTGHSVWNSPRLPADPLERGAILTEARAMLLKRLISAGVV